MRGIENYNNNNNNNKNKDNACLDSLGGLLWIFNRGGGRGQS